MGCADGEAKFFRGGLGKMPIIDCNVSVMAEFSSKIAKNRIGLFVTVVAITEDVAMFVIGYEDAEFAGSAPICGW